MGMAPVCVKLLKSLHHEEPCHHTEELVMADSTGFKKELSIKNMLNNLFFELFEEQSYL